LWSYASADRPVLPVLACSARRASSPCRPLYTGVDSLPVISSRHLHADLPEHTVGQRPEAPVWRATCVTWYRPSTCIVDHRYRTAATFSPEPRHSGDVIVTGKT